MLPQSHAGELISIQENNHAGGIILFTHSNFHHFLSLSVNMLLPAIRREGVRPLMGKKKTQ